MDNRIQHQTCMCTWNAVWMFGFNFNGPTFLNIVTCDCDLFSCCTIIRLEIKVDNVTAVWQANVPYPLTREN